MVDRAGRWEHSWAGVGGTMGVKGWMSRREVCETGTEWPPVPRIPIVARMGRRATEPLGTDRR